MYLLILTYEEPENNLQVVLYDNNLNILIDFLLSTSSL